MEAKRVYGIFNVCKTRGGGGGGGFVVGVWCVVVVAVVVRRVSPLLQTTRYDNIEHKYDST